ncbi:Pyruvate orthophosphate dikinase regulatory protein [Rhynchospora pubera]|uniref:Pyruvate orthophosphate dikinase regulatory protein n=1 Tax=Rhynchospora pubera TaxID=906938 RepID=A0AAV8E0D3_9POAL|nr:Pyruvate orthophosphate dikinase regulatory protein [Rhynchospora pubera]KAJ4786998.1 Pyruvate orthophosphate dikinase regulatory protein [Rhynchospora pubera]
MSHTKLLSFSRHGLSETTIPSSPDPTGTASCCPNQDQIPIQPKTDRIGPQSPTGRASSQLRRWSHVRSIRPSRVLSSHATREKTGSSAGDVKEEMELMDGPDGYSDVMNPGRKIYMVSDGTGWTAEHSVYATLRQFENGHVDMGCQVNTQLFPGVEDMDGLLDIIRQAARENALLLYTLVDPTMAEATKQTCNRWGVRSIDILRPTTEGIAEYLGVAPLVITRGSPAKLTVDYSRLIHDAIDFTMKHDDGAQPYDLSQADIVLVGPSRTGKTPLSIYLAQKGYKVANVPIIMGMDLPITLFEMEQEKIFGLTISATVLLHVRMERAKELGFHGTNYSDMDHVRQELEYAHKIFAQNPSWPVIDVTGKAMEETASVILRTHNEKQQKWLMPPTSKRY